MMEVMRFYIDFPLIQDCIHAGSGPKAFVSLQLGAQEHCLRILSGLTLWPEADGMCPGVECFGDMTLG